MHRDGAEGGELVLLDGWPGKFRLVSAAQYEVPLMPYSGRCYDPMNILLISPEVPSTFWSFKYALRFVGKQSAFPPLGLLTVAAMLPAEWDLRLRDLEVSALTDEDLRWADYVMISAMIIHVNSVRCVAARCAQFGKPLIAGGPLFATGHERFPEIPHFVLGEAEEIMARVVSDMQRGQLEAVYRATGFPAVSQVPIPRWDLIETKNYVSMAVQFSRGCPFDCEFCDIVAMNGRVPRTKAPEQLIAELQSLHDRGWKGMVFLVDDNFIGNKRATRELLRKMVQWRDRVRPSMGFLTEASVNLADDAEMCSLMVDAGFKKVFVGIETPSADSLKECHKLQNVGRDLYSSIRQLQAFGLEVMGGFIVGFDSDAKDIFRRQFDFIQNSGVVTAMVGLLTALPQTRLWRRLKDEGRLEAQSTGDNTSATLNFIPKLNRDFLQSGYRELMKTLYEPRVYYRRISTFLNYYRPSGPRVRPTFIEVVAALKAFWVLGVIDATRFAYWRLLIVTFLRRPSGLVRVIELSITGYHFRRIAESL